MQVVESQLAAARSHVVDPASQAYLHILQVLALLRLVRIPLDEVGDGGRDVELVRVRVGLFGLTQGEDLPGTPLVELVRRQLLLLLLLCFAARALRLSRSSCSLGSCSLGSFASFFFSLLLSSFELATGLCNDDTVALHQPSRLLERARSRCTPSQTHFLVTISPVTSSLSSLAASAATGSDILIVVAKSLEWV